MGDENKNFGCSVFFSIYILVKFLYMWLGNMWMDVYRFFVYRSRNVKYLLIGEKRNEFWYIYLIKYKLFMVRILSEILEVNFIY